MHNINLLIMLLIITGIGFIWFLLYEARENFEKKNKGVDEFDILSETNIEAEDEPKVAETEDDDTVETVISGDNTVENVIVEETTTETPSTPKKKRVRKNNKKKNK